MTDPLPMRLRRLVHSVTERSAPRVLRFLATNPAADAAEEAQLREALARSPAEVVNPDLPALPTDADVFPPYVFQTWKSRSVIPDNYRYWRQTFVDNNPGWDVLLWDDADNRRLVAAHFPWFLPVYDAYPKEIFRADAVRFCFLFLHGGFYADMDTECVRPVATHLTTGDVVLCPMGGDFRFDHALPNAVMASKPGQLFWLLGLKRMMEAAAEAGTPGRMAELGPETLTGPILLKRTYEEYVSLDATGLGRRLADVIDGLSAGQRAIVRGGRVELLPADAWYPLDWTNQFHKRLCDRLRKDRRVLSQRRSRALFPHSDVVTYWSHSW